MFPILGRGYLGHIREKGETGRHLGGIWAKGGPEEDLKEIVPKHMCFSVESGASDQLRVHESDLTLTKSAACAQKLAGDRGEGASDTLMDILT